ncbi:MAG: hypothetical protein LWY06_05010 [Firmicutes bacterium]|nr:hypothetical protein [Bacillota bacterium]
MIFSSLTDLFYDKIRETPSNTAFSRDKVKKWLNEAYFSYLNSYEWSFLTTEEELRNVYTVASAPSTGTTLYPLSTEGMTGGMRLRIYNGDSFQQVQIRSVSGETVSLREPGLMGTVPEGALITSPVMFLPFDCGKLLSVEIQSSSGTARRLTCLRNEEIPSFTEISTTGFPSVYIKAGRNSAAEGFPTGITAQSGTSAGKIVMPSSYNTPDNWFANWNLINMTRGTVSRVTQHDGTAKTLEISPVSESQTSGDSFYLRADLDQIFVYPVPDRVFKFTVRYRKICQPLVSDTDSPETSLSCDGSFLADYAVSEALLADRNTELATLYRQKFNTALDELKAQDIFPPDYLPGFRYRR